MVSVSSFGKISKTYTASDRKLISYLNRLQLWITLYYWNRAQTYKQAKNKLPENVSIMESCAPGLTSWNFVFLFFPL